MVRPPGIAHGCADLLVVHPPTLPTLAREAPDAGGGVDAYQDDPIQFRHWDSARSVSRYPDALPSTWRIIRSKSGS